MKKEEIIKNLEQLFKCDVFDSVGVDLYPRRSPELINTIQNLRAYLCELKETQIPLSPCSTIEIDGEMHLFAHNSNGEFFHHTFKKNKDGYYSSDPNPNPNPNV